MLENKRQKRSSSPRPRNFDASKHGKIIDQLHVRMLGGEFEKACEEIALDILTNYEGFEWAEKGPDFRGTPFDFFGLKNGSPYIIELKASLKSFNAPGETQKWRIQELLKRIEYLNIALLQLKLNKAEYRIFYDEEMEILFKGTKTPLDPIERWIRERFGNIVVHLIPLYSLSLHRSFSCPTPTARDHSIRWKQTTHQPIPSDVKKL